MLMFEEALPKPPPNPFDKLEGIYKIKLKTDVAASLRAVRYQVSYSLQCQFNDLEKVIAFYRNQKPKASLTSILKVLNVSDADLARIPNVTDDEVMDYWEITTKESDIRAMGASRHWTSCYNRGAQPNQIIEATKGKGIALVRKLDKDKSIKERFLVVGDVVVGEGQFATKGRVKASNYKGNNQLNPPKVFDALYSGKATKLEGKELEDFSW